MPLEVLNFGVNYGNTNKFTGGIPSEWGALTNLKELKMAFCGLDGKPLSIRSERFIFRVAEFHFFAGQLPKELGKLVNLTYFSVAGNELQGGLSTRSTTSCSLLTCRVVAQFRTKRRRP